MAESTAIGLPHEPEDVPALEPATAAFYCHTAALLIEAQIPFLIGGAYAIAHYTGIARHTKDLDLFVKRADIERVLARLQAAGYRTELTFPHWLGKAFHDDRLVDIIFSSGNGLAVVDDSWFERAPSAQAFGLALKLVPIEEMIWSKAFIMERERFDGADVAHLLRAQAASIDWAHLVALFDGHWRVLLSHLVLFGFIYPDRRTQVPPAVVRGLMTSLDAELGVSSRDRACNGTLLSRAQYLVDLSRTGYEDARLPPHGVMSRSELAVWNEALERDAKGQPRGDGSRR
jgi:hypothetical protein